jgi:hypothetical protein
MEEQIDFSVVLVPRQLGQGPSRTACAASETDQTAGTDQKLLGVMP